ncbi:helix-turn-helix domain-containing protein [Pseudorhodoferax sp. LjRoot39]
MKEKEVVRSLTALAQGIRLQVFRALVESGQAGMTPSMLADRLSMPASSLSFHLKELLNSGLVSHVREHRNLIYRAEYSTMNELLAYLSANCCAGESCSLDSAQLRCE